jgi:hypothetical protein
LATGTLNINNVTDEQFVKLLQIKDKSAGKLVLSPNNALSPVTVGNPPKPGFNGIVLLFNDAQGCKSAAEVLDMLAT